MLRIFMELFILMKQLKNRILRIVNNFLVMGPWSHGQWASGEANNLGNIYWGLDANKKFRILKKISLIII